MWFVSQVEKTKHYLLLREKLESTMLMGQEALQSCITEELSESHQPPEVEQEVSSSSEITTERQRELAAKVSHHHFVDTEFSVDWSVHNKIASVNLTLKEYILPSASEHMVPYF